MPPPPNSSGWRHNLFSCINASTCCTGFFCNACIFGRTQHRLQNFPLEPESTSFNWCNSSCALMACATCLLLPWLPVWQQRNDVRRTFGIAGGGCIDCLTTYFCNCCAIVQHENELREQSEMARNGRSGYRAPGSNMMYQPQQQPAIPLRAHDTNSQPTKDQPPAYETPKTATTSHDKRG